MSQTNSDKSRQSAVSKFVDTVSKDAMYLLKKQSVTILQLGAQDDLIIKIDKNTFPYSGFNALHAAAFVGNLSMVKYLVDEVKVNVRARTSNSQTALHLGCLRGHANVVQYLLSKLNVTSSDDVWFNSKRGRQTPLHICCIKNNAVILKIILNLNNFIPDLKALQICARMGATSCLQLIMPFISLDMMMAAMPKLSEVSDKIKDNVFDHMYALYNNYTKVRFETCGQLLSTMPLRVLGKQSPCTHVIAIAHHSNNNDIILTMMRLYVRWLNGNVDPRVFIELITALACGLEVVKPQTESDHDVIRDVIECLGRKRGKIEYSMVLRMVHPCQMSVVALACYNSGIKFDILMSLMPKDVAKELVYGSEYGVPRLSPLSLAISQSRIDVIITFAKYRCKIQNYDPTVLFSSANPWSSVLKQMWNSVPFCDLGNQNVLEHTRDFIMKLVSVMAQHDAVMILAMSLCLATCNKRGHRDYEVGFRFTRWGHTFWHQFCASCHTDYTLPDGTVASSYDLLLLLLSVYDGASHVYEDSTSIIGSLSERSNKNENLIDVACRSSPESSQNHALDAYAVAVEMPVASARLKFVEQLTRGIDLTDTDLLWSMGSDANCSKGLQAVFGAIKNGDLELIKLLIARHGFERDLKCSIQNGLNADLFTPMQYALDKCPDAVELFTDLSAKPKAFEKQPDIAETPPEISQKDSNPLPKEISIVSLPCTRREIYVPDRRGGLRLVHDKALDMFDMHAIRFREAISSFMAHDDTEAVVKTKPKHVVTSAEQIIVQLFIASPFISFEEERSVIMNKIIPVLSSRLSSRHIKIVPIELRWGAADERSCLTQVSRCDAVVSFLCHHKMGTITNNPDVLRPGWPITVNELMMAMKHHIPTTLFLRNVDYLHSVPADVRGSWSSGDDSVVVRNAAIDYLTSHMHAMQYDGNSLSRSWTRVNDDAFIHTVIDPLEHMLESVIAQKMELLSNVLDPHLQFALERTPQLGYMSRDVVIERIMKYISDPGGRVLICDGKSGAGKTTVLCQAVQRLHDSKASMFCHFVGVEGQSTHMADLLLRLYTYLSQHIDIGDYVMPDIHDPLEYIRSLRYLFNKADNLIIFIDSVDQIVESDTQFVIDLVKHPLPDSVHVIVSVADHKRDLVSQMLHNIPSDGDVVERITIKSLKKYEMQQLVTTRFAAHGKVVKSDILQLLIDKHDSDSPLYLNYVCEELMASATHDNLKTLTQSLPGTTADLLNVMMDRIERICGTFVVSLFCMAVSVSHGAMNDHHLQSLLMAVGVDRLVIGSLFALMNVMLRVSNSISWFHGKLKRVMTERYARCSVKLVDDNGCVVVHHNNVRCMEICAQCLGRRYGEMTWTEIVQDLVGIFVLNSSLETRDAGDMSLYSHVTQHLLNADNMQMAVRAVTDIPLVSFRLFHDDVVKVISDIDAVSTALNMKGRKLALHNHHASCCLCRGKVFSSGIDVCHYDVDVVVSYLELLSQLITYNSSHLQTDVEALVRLMIDSEVPSLAIAAAGLEVQGPSFSLINCPITTDRKAKNFKYYCKVKSRMTCTSEVNVLARLGNMLATGHKDGSVFLWNLVNGTPVKLASNRNGQVLSGTGRILGIAWTKNKVHDDMLVVTSANGELFFVKYVHGFDISSIIMSNRVRVFDPECEHGALDDETCGIMSLRVVDGLIICGSADGKIIAVDIDAPESIQSDVLVLDSSACAVSCITPVIDDVVLCAVSNTLLFVHYRRESDSSLSLTVVRDYPNVSRDSIQCTLVDVRDARRGFVYFASRNHMLQIASLDIKTQPKIMIDIELTSAIAFEAHHDVIHAMIMYRDCLITGAWDHTAKMWMCDSGPMSLKVSDGVIVHKHGHFINDLICSDDGTLITGSVDRSAVVLDIKSSSVDSSKTLSTFADVVMSDTQAWRKISRSVEHHHSDIIRGLDVFMTDHGMCVFTGSWDGTAGVLLMDAKPSVSLFNLNHEQYNMRQIFKFSGGKKRVNAVCHNSNYLFIGGGDGRFYVFDMGGHAISAADVNASIETEQKAAIMCLSCNGSYVAAGLSSGCVAMFDKNGTYQSSFTVQSNVWITAVLLSTRNDDRLIVGTAEGNVCVYRSGMLSCKLTKQHVKPILALAYSPDERYVVSGSEDFAITVYSTYDGEVVGVGHEHRNEVTSVCFPFTDSRKFVSGSQDGYLITWQIANDELTGVGSVTAVGKHYVPGCSITSMATSSDIPNRIIIGDSAGRIYVFSS